MCQGQAVQTWHRIAVATVGTGQYFGLGGWTGGQDRGQKEQQHRFEGAEVVGV